jgi:histidinol dehydrogenase
MTGSDGGLVRRAVASAGERQPEAQREGVGEGGATSGSRVTLAREDRFLYKDEFPRNAALRRLDTRTPDFPRAWAELCARGSDEDEAGVREVAGRIVADVRARGDAALLEHTRRLDAWTPASAAALVLGPDDFARAFRDLSPEGRRALQLAARRITDFHRRERDAEVPARRDPAGATLSQVVRPLDRVGLYVPGGTARYPSSVLMTAIPARVARVREVVVTSPGAHGSGEVDGWTLAACHAARVDRLFRVGGAQAVAALAYGTATVGPVDKICGPGNAYVAAAKRLVFGRVDIDMIAGPSEILVVADGDAEPVEVASDLIAQAEHDVRAVAVLVTPSAALAGAVAAEVERQLQALPRREIAARSLADRGAVVRCRGIAEAVKLADAFAPEHLALHVTGAARLVPRIARAGAVFVGRATPEAVGDYVAGPSHVLPTAGTARFASPLSVATFRRRMSVLDLAPRALAALAPAVEALARAEGLLGHWRAVEVRVRPRGEQSARTRKGPAGQEARARAARGGAPASVPAVAQRRSR